MFRQYPLSWPGFGPILNSLVARVWMRYFKVGSEKYLVLNMLANSKIFRQDVGVFANTTNLRLVGDFY